MVKYGEYLKIKEIVSNPQNATEFRYSLKVSFVSAKQQKKLLVLMMNPSRAREGESDRTVNKVLNMAYNNDYTEVEIFNISPYYLTNSKKLASFFKNKKKSELEEMHKKNFDLFNESVKDHSEDILIATGNQNIKIMRDLYMEFFCKLEGKKILFYRKTKKGYYQHPLYASQYLKQGKIERP